MSLYTLNNSLINPDNSHLGTTLFTDKTVPFGPHTLPPSGSNVQGAAGIYPGVQNGGKRRKLIRRKRNKISMKYKMNGTKRAVKRRSIRSKSARRSRSKSARRSISSKSARRSRSKRRSTRSKSARRTRSKSLKKNMRGGMSQGYSQYMNNNGGQSNTYSLCGPLTSGTSALASPPPHSLVAGHPDNLNHAAPNAYGNYGAGSGFASRGWF